MAQPTNVIEDVLESLSNLPNSVKRNFELMRELDLEVHALLAEVAEAEATIVAKAQRAFEHPNNSKLASVENAIAQEEKVLESVMLKRRRCDELQDEKVLIAEQTNDIVLQHIEMMNTELAGLSAHLHSTGEFESSGAARPGDEVAVLLDEDDKDAWILARVVRFKPETAMYDVADADDDRKVYELPETRVVPLTDSAGRGVVAAPHALAPVASVLASIDGAPGEVKISKGDEVFAVYPDTTSFYAGTISRPPRRGGDSGVCHVQFNDDADETGLTPDRAVPLKYIIRLI